MADSADKKVDEAIAEMQACLDRLKAAQKSDDDYDEPEPKTLSEAGAQARKRFAQARSKSGD